MRAAIYNPYLDTLGGGERYTMTVAHILKKHGWDVDIQWSDPKILNWLTERLGIDLTGVRVIPRIADGKGYDFVFWLSDGSIPALLGRKNILHFQTPFHNVDGKSLFNRLKLARINKIVCNSQFTKGFIDNEYGVESVVVYPPVDVLQFKPGKKESLIVFVGRFSRLQQSKGQEVLIQAFKNMCNNGLSSWKLVLAGGSEIGGGEFVTQLKKEAEGYPIEILENLPFEEIRNLYAKAKIFWSASGFGINEQEEPEKVEHFGITVIEAMAAGCVPIVVNKGGHKEIVDSEENGFLWDKLEELESITQELISDERRRGEIAQASHKRAGDFSEKRFEKEILQIVKG